MHFVRTFEELGFFIDLLGSAMFNKNMKSFLVSYIIFGMCFSVCYTVIGSESGDNLPSAVGLGDFGRTFLFVWGNGACTFGLMSYPTLMAQHTTTDAEYYLKYVNISIIWVLYFLQVQFQTMFGLNFIVAIVEENYGIMMEKRQMCIYKSKAELNHECF